MELFLELILNPFVLACVVGYSALLVSDIVNACTNRKKGRPPDQQD